MRRAPAGFFPGTPLMREDSIMQRVPSIAAIVALPLTLSGCLVTGAVGLAVDVVETAVMVPIKVGGAVVDAVSSDDKEKAKEKEKTPGRKNDADQESTSQD